MHLQTTVKTILCGLLCAGCACVSAQTLRIATLPAADSIVLDVAVNEGLFKKEGLDVQTVPFKSALEVGAAMRAGQLAGHFGDLMNVFTQNETGAAQAVVLTTTHTTPAQRAFGMVVSPKYVDKIKSLNDLKATPTAMSASTIIDYLLTRMKETAGVKSDSLKNVEVRQIPIRLQMLLSGQIETALLPEPLVTVVEKKGGRVIWDDTKLDESLAVVALRQPYLDDRTVTAFRKAVAEAARKTLLARGDESTGWSMAWKINFWARLRDGNHAWKLLTDLLPNSVSSSLMLTYGQDISVRKRFSD